MISTGQIHTRKLFLDLLPATIIMRIEKIFSLSVSEATLPNPTLRMIIKMKKGKMKVIVMVMAIGDGHW